MEQKDEEKNDNPSALVENMDSSDYLVSRDSINSLKQQGSTYANIILKEVFKSGYEDRSFNLAYLKKEFRNRELEALFRRYEQRSMIGTFTQYLTVQTFLSLAYIATTAIQCHASDDETSDGKCSSVYVPSELPNIVGYSVIFTTCIILLLCVYNERSFKKRPWLLYVYSFFIVITIEAIDIGLVVWQSKPSNNNSVINPAHPLTSKVPILSLYNLMIIYLFLPIARKTVTIALGTMVSIICLAMYIAIGMVLDNENNIKYENINWYQICAEIIFYATLNFIGVYVRYVGEIFMRRGFLDKRGCIETTFKLKYEKEQEENLLLSIIPKQIATQVRDGIWGHLERTKTIDDNRAFNELFVERHENVSILFADICNFTQLTTRLTVEKLVETLNDLFGKFDDAGEKNSCMRIKILGDCYYCVAGVPDEDEDHAHHTVQMGLDMIELIQDVRKEHEVDVNMRIGVHSGYILSGIIGMRKWQFDIWSKDVTIANHMESTGEKGAVHITEQTRLCLDASMDKDHLIPFVCEPVKRDLEDEILKRNDIKTFLIRPKKSMFHVTRKCAHSSQYPDGLSAGENRSTGGTRVSNPSMSSDNPSFLPDDDGDSFCSSASPPVSKRQMSVLMDPSVKNYQKLVKSAKQFMRDEIEKLPLSKYADCLHPGEIDPWLLLFRDKSWERPYLMEYDPLFKFYILSTFIIFIMSFGILLLTEDYFHLPLILAFTAIFVFLVCLLPCLWVSFIWDSIIDPHHEYETIEEPEHRIIRWFYSSAKRINMSLVIRTIIFFIVYVMVFISAIMDIATATGPPCYDERAKNYTYRCLLATIVIFMFLRIPWLLKLAATLLAFGTLYWGICTDYFMPEEQIINIFSTEYFGYDEIFNESHRKYSHFLFLSISALFFILIDRRHEFMHRLDYQWKRQLKCEQEQASATKLVNKMLLQNILPHHVAERYLSNNQEVTSSLYSESYHNVAVIFASIPDYLDFYTEAEVHKKGVACLEILNDIIVSFDKLLFNKEFARIEKIKVISSTYMAACGLQPGRKGSIPGHNGFGDTRYSRNSTSIGIPNDKSRQSTATQATTTTNCSSLDCEPYGIDANASTMAEFAAAMMRAIAEISVEDYGISSNSNGVKSKRSFQLRIGLSAGPVIAGVVGAQKPLYDIWGNTVNVASRMDYTGVLGKIQCPDEVAECLERDGVSCSFRDVIFVKGKGNMRTHFINLTDDTKVLRIKDKSQAHLNRSLSAVSSSCKGSVKHSIMAKMSLIDGTSEIDDDATNDAVSIDKSLKKFVRQEAMEKDDDLSSKDSSRNRCQIKVTSGDDDEILPNENQSYEESGMRQNDSLDRGWSTTSQQNSESDDDFSLMPDRSLSRSSEATSDQDSISSESFVNSVIEEFEVKQVELDPRFDIHESNLGTENELRIETASSILDDISTLAGSVIYAGESDTSTVQGEVPVQDNCDEIVAEEESKDIRVDNVLQQFNDAIKTHNGSDKDKASIRSHKTSCNSNRERETEDRTLESGSLKTLPDDPQTDNSHLEEVAYDQNPRDSKLPPVTTNNRNQAYSGQTLLPAHMTYKKDSGYGSQGQLKLEALRLSSEGLLSNSQVQMKIKQSFESSDASETDSPNSSFSYHGQHSHPVIIPKGEKDLAEFYDRLNLE